MEIKGEDFIKNVQIKQEKNDLRIRLEELESADNSNTFTYEDEIDQTESELDDIMLGATEPEKPENNNKKYIVLGLILAVLFLITIIIFRLLNNQTSTDDSFVQNSEEIIQDKQLDDDDNIEQQYQKIIKQKMEDIKIKEEKTEIEKKAINDALNLEKIQQEEKKISLPQKAQAQEKAKELKKDIFEITKKEEPKPVVKKEPIKEVKKAPIKKVQEVKKAVTQKTVTTNQPDGTYIQVGAFTKEIDPKYLQNLKSKNISYTIYKEVIKGKNYTKVLVGPYKNRTDAKSSRAVKLLNIKNPYIRSF